MLTAENIISETTIQSLLQIDSKGIVPNKEDGYIEYKRIYDRASKEAIIKYVKTMAAFYNCGGGFLIFGVDDKTRELIGLSDEFVEPENLEINRFIEKYFTNSIRFQSKVYIVSGKIVFVIHVEKRKSVPTLCKRDYTSILNEGIIYYRYSGESKPVRPEELQRILTEPTTPNYDPELRITFEDYTSYISDGASPEIYITIELKIVNPGSNTIFIERPTIEVANDYDETIQLMVIVKDFNNHITQYPFALRYGEFHSVTYIKDDITNYINKIKSLQPLTRFRFCVSDSLKNNHYSNWKELPSN